MICSQQGGGAERIDPSGYFPLKMGEPARFMLVEGYGKSPTSTVELDLWLFQVYIPTMREEEHATISIYTES
jgi:hypothetical protein